MTTDLFDVIIIHLYLGSYLCMTPGKALAKLENENKTSTYSPVCSVGISSLLWFYQQMEPQERKNKPPIDEWPRTSDLS